MLTALPLPQGEGGPGRRRDLAVQAVTDKLYVSPALETVSWANESGYPAYLYVHRTRVGKNHESFHAIPDSHLKRLFLFKAAINLTPLWINVCVSFFENNLFAIFI